MVIICSASLDIPDGAGPEAFPIKKEVYIEWSSHFGKWHRQTFGETHPQITVSIMAHLKQFMQHRQCWACVPISVAVGLEKTCEIKRVIPDFSLPNREVSLITKWGKTHSAPLSAFFDCLRKALSVYPEINILI
jgi:DNA-binding transcriptional LysR family regulator